VVVCINSIARVLPRFDLVVMDEVNFTLTNMASTVMKDKKLVFLALEGIVAGAKAAFLSDAHLNCPRDSFNSKSHCKDVETWSLS
jgi:hypothetical protein